MKHSFFLIAMSLLTLFAVPQSAAEGLEDKPKLFQNVTQESQQAVMDGLAWLAKAQSRNGSWGNRYTVAVTSLSCLSFMAGGHVPGRGQYAEHVQDGVNYIMSCANRKGFITSATVGGGGESRMHGHGYATLMLAEVYGMTQSIEGNDTSELKETLKRAIHLIENSQDMNGGWSYNPFQQGHEGSITVTQIHALRAARNAGLKVNIKVIQKAVEYIKKSTNADGTVNYSLGMTRSSFPLTAAGVCVMLYLGMHEDQNVKKGIQALFKYGDQSKRASHFFYGNFYATIAMFHAGSPHWERWWPPMMELLLSRRSTSTPYWEAPYGREYGTAFACMMLQAPYQYLPIFQK